MAIDAGEPQYGHSQLERMTVEEQECYEDLSSSLAIAPHPMTSCAELMRTNDPINLQLTPLHDDDVASVSYTRRRPSNEDDEAILRRDPLLRHVLAQTVVARKQLQSMTIEGFNKEEERIANLAHITGKVIVETQNA